MGDNIILNVDVHDNCYSPRFMWTKDGDPVDTQHYYILNTCSSSRLEIKCVTLDDAGIYVVTASNLFGTEETSCRIKIKGRYSPNLSISSRLSPSFHMYLISNLCFGAATPPRIGILFSLSEV